MASSSSGPANKANLPLYYRGIPKDIGKKKVEPEKKPLDKFSASILANFERNRKAAREKRLAEEAAQRKALEEAAARKEEERLAQGAREGRHMLGLDRPTNSVAKRRSSGGSASRSRASNGASSSKRGAITKRKGGASSRGKRSRRKDDSDDDGPTPMSKGMEIVRAKKREKGPTMRNTSDYSDLFGETYLLGADVEITRELAKTSRQETELVRAAAQKEREEYERVKRESEKYDRVKRRMEASGELNTKRGKEKLGMLRKKLQGDRYEIIGDASARPAASHSASLPKKKANGSSVSPGESIEARKARLLARLQGPQPESEKPVYEASRSPPQRKSRPPPVPSVSRRGRYRDVVDSDEDEPPRRRRFRDVADSDIEDPPRRQRYRDDDPPRRKRARDVVDSDDDEFAYRQRKTAKKRKSSYISDTDEEDGDDYDDRNGDFGNFETTFEEVEIEERKSAYWAKQEDKKEKRKLDKAKQEKRNRRRAAGLDSESEEEDDSE